MVETLEIMIVDDDEDDHFFFKESISHKKLLQPHITSLFHGRDLMDYLLAKGVYKGSHPVLPDLIVLDLNMPYFDGLSALKEIKSNKKLKTIPVFILTVSRSEEDKQLCKSLGSREFYIKPTTGEDLKVIIDDILEKCTTAY